MDSLGHVGVEGGPTPIHPGNVVVFMMYSFRFGQT